MAWNSEAGKEGQRESSSCRDSFPQPEQNIRTLLLEELENSASSAVPSCETRNGDLGGTCTGRLRAPVHSRSSMPPGWAQWTQQLGETVTSVSVREGNTGPESMKTRKKKKKAWLREGNFSLAAGGPAEADRLLGETGGPCRETIEEPQTAQR